MILPAVPAIASAAYQLLAAIAGVLWRLSRPASRRSFSPPVSILKPIRGLDEDFPGAIASHARLSYPDFEILFGFSDPADPAKAAVAALQHSYPGVNIRILDCPTDAPNAKAGVLEQLSAAARHPYLVVNDSDIFVPPDYLHRIVAPLAGTAGLVTCLYKARGKSLPARFEALGIATEFAPSVLLARLVGVREFAMGSTLAFRAGDLARAGGFAAVRDFLADDYQLGKNLTAAGLAVTLSMPVVETSLGASGWSAVWQHQLRWSRTVRVSRPAGYLGYVVTFTLVWSLVAALGGNFFLALACYAARLLTAAISAGPVLGDRASLRLIWLLPLRDAFGFAIWTAAFFGNTVEWRGRRLRLSKDGRIEPSPAVDG